MQSFLTDILSTSSDTTETVTCIKVSRRVHVQLLNQLTDQPFKTFKLDVECPSKLPNLASLLENNKKLWKTIKSCIPQHLEDNKYTRTRYHISVFQSERTQEYVRNLNVMYKPVDTETKSKTRTATTTATTTTPKSKTLQHVSDDVMLEGFASMLPSRSLVNLAFTCRRYRTTFLTSSFVVVKALQKEKKKTKQILSTFDASDVHRELTCTLSSLTFASDSEVSAVQGALSSFISTTSSSMSNGFICAFGFILGLHLQSRDYETFHKLPDSATIDGVPVTMKQRGAHLLLLVSQRKTKLIVQKLQKYHAGAWISLIASNSNLWRLENYFNLLIETSTMKENIIPKILHELCNDSTIVLVDSTPLQRLASRFLKILQASFQKIIHSIPFIVSKHREEELEKIENRFLNRYQRYKQGVATLNEFQKRGWPEIDIKLSLPVLAALDCGNVHRCTLKLAKCCGLIKKR